MGWLPRVSITRKAARDAADRAPKPSTVAEVQPSVPPRIRRKTSEPTDTVKEPMPAQSIRPALGLRDSGSTARDRAMATTLTGRLTRKIHRQPKYSVSSPPRTGPTAAAAPLTAPQTPKAIPRSRPW